MTGAWGRWTALLDRREPGDLLALVRVLVGLTVLAGVLEVVRPGLVPLLWFDVADGGYRPLPHGSWLTALLGGPSPGLVWGLVGATLVAGALLVVGLVPRLAALVALQGWLGLAWINGHAGGSYDNLVANALWLMVLARSDATLSLACRLRTGRWTSAAAVPAWPRWLMALQLVVMYTSTGLQKVSAHWVPGGDLDALYYILQQPSWQRFDGAWAARVAPLLKGATLSVWLWEVGAPLVLVFAWLRHTGDRGGRLRALAARWDLRTAFVAFGVAMHLGIHALMDVGPFSYASLAMYPAFFAPHELGRCGRGALAVAALLPLGADLILAGG